MVTLNQFALPTDAEDLAARADRPDRVAVLGSWMHIVDVSAAPVEVGTWAYGGCSGADTEFLDGGDKLVVSCGAHHVYNTLDGTLLNTLSSNVHPNNAAGTANGRYLALGVSGTYNEDVYIYDLENPSSAIQIHEITGTAGMTWTGAMAWSSNTGTLFAAASEQFGPTYLYMIFDATKRATTLQLAGPATMRANTPTTISGSLTSLGDPLAGTVLTVSRTGGGEAVTLPDVTTDAAGGFSFSDTVTRPGAYTYSAHYLGDDSHLAADGVASVRVKTLPWDINGDGMAELVTGALGEDLNSIMNAGIFHVINSGPTKLTATGSKIYTQDTAGVPDLSQSGDQLGWTQASGDFNGDGYADVAVSANAEDLGNAKNTGVVHIFYGAATGLRTDNATLRSLANTTYGARSYTYFGDALAVGDFDGDLLADLAIGASGFGRVFVAKGTPSGLSTSLTVFRQGAGGAPGAHQSNDLFGFSLAAGDVNADLRDDLAVGAPWDWEDRGWSTGSVTVLYGSDAGLSGMEAQRWSKDSWDIAGTPGGFSSDWSDSVGWQVALADHNGDGFADLTTTAPGANVVYGSATRKDAGTVSIIYGSFGKLTTAGNRQLHQGSTGIPDSPETGDLFGMTLAGGDANGDGYAELAIATSGDEAVTVLRGTASKLTITGAVAWSQNSSGVHGTTKSGDGFGSSLRFAYFRGGAYAGLAIGIPGEDLGRGGVEVLYGGGGGLTSNGAQYFTQDTAGVPDVAQAGDMFGSFF